MGQARRELFRPLSACVEGRKTQAVKSPGWLAPYIKFDLSLPSALKGAERVHRGRLWLDAETAQIRREVREMTLQPPSVNRPLVFIRYEFEYADSRFGFLTPKRIVITNYSRGRTGADKKPELLLGGRITFDYGAFTRFDVAAPDASVTPSGQ